MHHLLTVALLSLLATTAVAAPGASIAAPEPASAAMDRAARGLVDVDEGMGSALALVPSFDVEARAGSLVAVGRTSGGETLMQRPGEAVLRIHEVDAEGAPMFLVLWRSLEKPGVLRPELWSSDGSQIWGNLPRVTWEDARVEVRHEDGEWALLVSRSLTGENGAAPRLRKRERYRVTSNGLVADAHRYAKVETPEQRLDLIADLGARGKWASMVGQVKGLPRTTPEYLQRAAIVLSRFPASPAARGKSRLLLETMAAGSSRPNIVMSAADRLLEMAWEDSATEEGPSR